MILQELTGLKLRAILVCQSIHHAHVRIHPNLIQVTEWSATERSKASTKDESNVTHNRAFNDSVLQTLGSFIHKSGEQNDSLKNDENKQKQTATPRDSSFILTEI
jgi:hypothetical protein